MTAPFRSALQRGMSLIEAVATLMILAFFALIFAPRLPSTDAATLGSQAQSLAADLRRTQTMAMTSGSSVCLRRISATQYGIFATTKSGGITQCTESIVINPATGNSSSLMQKDPLTGQDAVYTLSQNATLAGDSSVIFNSLGKTVTSASFYVQSQDQYRTVSVDPGTGLVSVSSQNSTLPTPQTPP